MVFPFGEGFEAENEQISELIIFNELHELSDKTHHWKSSRIYFLTKNWQPQSDILAVSYAQLKAGCIQMDLFLAALEGKISRLYLS